MTPIIFGAALSLLAAGVTPAQPSAAPVTVGQVVVQGQRPQAPKSFSATVSKFVAAHAQVSPAGTLARWMRPVCPGTAGLTPAFDAYVNQRITEIAARAGAPTPKLRAGARAPSRCVVNVLVFFTSEPQKFLDGVRAKHSSLLGYYHFSRGKELATFEGPIGAWHTSGTRFAQTGMTYFDDPDANAGNSNNQPPWRQVGDESRLKFDRADEFLSALVIVDSNAVEGQSITAIADHIALLVLSDPKRSKECSPLPSLLDALNPACPASASVETLTVYDEAFLRRLYASNPEETLQGERGSIELGIMRDTRPPPATAEAAGATPPPH
jgi:hypothetical protein